MEIHEIAAVFGLFEMAFGVLYMFFGKGPSIPGVPQWVLTLSRLFAPLLMLSFAAFQRINREAHNG